MGRFARLSAIGGFTAVALVAHLWMFPAYGGPAIARHDMAAAMAHTSPLPPGSCAAGMTACIAAPAEDPRLPLVLLVSSFPVLLVALLRMGQHRRIDARSRARGPGPPRSPVDTKVLLLE